MKLKLTKNIQSMDRNTHGLKPVRENIYLSKHIKVRQISLPAFLTNCSYLFAIHLYWEYLITNAGTEICHTLHIKGKGVGSGVHKTGEN